MSLVSLYLIVFRMEIYFFVCSKHIYWSNVYETPYEYMKGTNGPNDIWFICETCCCPKQSLCSHRNYSLRTWKHTSLNVDVWRAIEFYLILISWFYFVSFQFNGATYHSKLQTSGGGVGRNIAEGISKLHGGAHLISMVGNDQVN